MRNVFNTGCRKNQNTHFVFNKFFFENRTVYKKMWKNIVGRGRPQMTIWSMRNARWIAKATNTHSGCVTRIAFPLQVLQERVSMLRHTYIGCIAILLAY
jgi:hypothetical protein